MHRGLKVLLAVTVAALATAAATLAAGSGSAATSDTLVFGTTSEPTSLDGAVVSDGESLRVIDQLTEGLVGLKPGTTTIQPLLARSWKATSNGRVWTFNLRSGVRFHDGTPFNAQAVCANFDRWYNFTGPFASDATSYYYYTVFSGYKKKAAGLTNSPLYRSCRAPNAVDGSGHAAARERRVPRRAVADVVPHPEPDRDDAVRREQGQALEGRRLHADRRVRRPRRPGSRHRAVQARVVEDRRPARDRAERPVLGPEGDPAARDLPGDPGQRRPPAGAPDRGDPGLRPRRAAGHPDDQEATTS